MKKVFLKASLLFLAGLFAVALTGELYASKAPRTRREKAKAKSEKDKKIESATAAAPLAVTKAIDATQKTMFPRFSYEEKQELHVACLKFFEIMHCFVAEKKKDNQPLLAILKNILSDAVSKIHACLAKKEIAFEDFADMVPALLVQTRLSNKDCDREQGEIIFINDCVTVCMKLIMFDGIVLKNHGAVGPRQDSRQDVKTAQEGKHKKIFSWGFLLVECVEQLKSFEENSLNKDAIAYSKDMLQLFLTAYFHKVIGNIQEAPEIAGQVALQALVGKDNRLAQAIEKIDEERRARMVGKELCTVLSPENFISNFFQYHQKTAQTVDDNFSTLLVTAFLSEKQKQVLDKDTPVLMKETHDSLVAAYKEYAEGQPQVMKLLSSGRQTNDVHGNSLVDYGLLIGNDMALKTVIHPNTIKTPNKHGVTPLAFVLMMHDADRLKVFLQRASEIMTKHEVMNLINETKVKGKHPFEYIGALSERGIDDSIVNEMRRGLCKYSVRQEDLRYMGLRHIGKEAAITTAREAQAHFLRQMRASLMPTVVNKEPMSTKIDGDADCENSLKEVKKSIKQEEQQKAKMLSRARNKKEAEKNVQKKKEKQAKDLKEAAAEAQRLERERERALALKEEADKKIQEEALRREKAQAEKQVRKQAAREATNRAQVECERELYRKRNQDILHKERAIMEAKQEQEITRDALLARWHRLAKLSIVKDTVLAAQSEMKNEKEQEEQARYELMRSLSLTKEQTIQLEMLKRNHELRQRRHNQAVVRLPGDGKKTVLRADAPVFTPGKK